MTAVHVEEGPDKGAIWHFGEPAREQRALQDGKSLLPAGITAIKGRFGRGDPVAIHAPEGHKLGQGLCRYTADEAQAIKGHRSDRIEALLGYPGRAALIHRDDMAL